MDTKACWGLQALRRIRVELESLIQEEGNQTM